MLCLADKKRVRTGAVELGKVLTPESPLLLVVPSRQEAGENWCSGRKRFLPWRAASSLLCPAGKKRVRTGAVELGKVLTPESRLLHVVPGEQGAGESRCNGTGQGA
jgi:hypothetical protein